jgi:hypothetical protein
VVISICALVVASSGTAFASGPIASIAKALGLNGKQKSQVTSIADAQIAAKAPTLSVLNATNATNAANATNATNAANAANATNATNAGNANTVGGDAPSAFLDAGRIADSGSVYTLPDTTSTPTTLFRAGQLTVQGTCTISSGTISLELWLDYPAGTVSGEGLETSADDIELDGDSTSSTTLDADSSYEDDFDVSPEPVTFVTPDGRTYQYLEGWDGLNYPSAGQCSFQVLLVQG